MKLSKIWKIYLEGQIPLQRRVCNPVRRRARASGRPRTSTPLRRKVGVVPPVPPMVFDRPETAAAPRTAAAKSAFLCGNRWFAEGSSVVVIQVIQILLDRGQ